MGNFKVLKSLKFKNIKIRGMYEHKLFPVELIFNVSFSITPTPIAKKEFDSNSNLIQVVKDKISSFSIIRNLRTVHLPNNWKFDFPVAVRYTYEHDYDIVKFGNKSCIGIDITTTILNPKLQKNDLYVNYVSISQDIASFNNFCTDKYFVIYPGRY